MLLWRVNWLFSIIDPDQINQLVAVIVTLNDFDPIKNNVRHYIRQSNAEGMRRNTQITRRSTWRVCYVKNGCRQEAHVLARRNEKRLVKTGLVTYGGLLLHRYLYTNVKSTYTRMQSEERAVL